MHKPLMIFLSVLLLTGCWDRREINDVAFVAGSGVDKKDGKYQVTIQILLPGQMGGAGSEGGGGGTGGGKSWYNESVEADNIRKANNEQQSRASRQLYFAHRRVFIFGEEMAKDGISKSLDILVRVPQNRLSAFAFVAKDEASKVLSTKVPLEKHPAEMIRELANLSFKNPRTLKDVMHLSLSEGIDLALPVVEVKKLTLEGKDVKETLQMAGLAVFHQSKLKGILEGEGASGILLAMNEAKSPDLLVIPPEGKGEINIRLPVNDTSIKPVFKGEQLSVDINIRAKGNVVGNESTYDLAIEENLLALESVVEEKIKKQVITGMEALQKEYQSDVVGLGYYIYLANPTLWKKIEPKWHEIYPNVNVNVNVYVHLEHTNSLSDPAGVKERQQND